MQQSITVAIQRAVNGEQIHMKGEIDVGHFDVAEQVAAFGGPRALAGFLAEVLWPGSCDEEPESFRRVLEEVEHEKQDDQAP